MSTIDDLIADYGTARDALERARTAAGQHVEAHKAALKNHKNAVAAALANGKPLPDPPVLQDTAAALAVLEQRVADADRAYRNHEINQVYDEMAQRVALRRWRVQRAIAAWYGALVVLAREGVTKDQMGSGLNHLWPAIPEGIRDGRGSGGYITDWERLTAAGGRYGAGNLISEMAAGGHRTIEWRGGYRSDIVAAIAALVDQPEAPAAEAPAAEEAAS
jgi:hypothetical protein